MPGFDRSGPMGVGPMSGGRRGLCSPVNSDIRTPFIGRNKYGRGMGFGYGFRGGFGFGRGFRRGFGRGFGGYPPEYGPTDPADPTSEIDFLKAEADSMKAALDTINRRITELEKFAE